MKQITSQTTKWRSGITENKRGARRKQFRFVIGSSHSVYNEQSVYSQVFECGAAHALNYIYLTILPIIARALENDNGMARARQHLLGSSILWGFCLKTGKWL